MDLGCLDMGCIEKQIAQKINLDSEKSPRNESSRSTSKSGKNKSPKEAGQSNTTGALNKVSSQIRKPPHRKTSPLNWFPRKKMDSYLNRKIKLLQEVDGMNLTLDETLGDSNPHYSKVLREKIALREAADRAVKAQKASLVEASWCRILKAAGIDSKEAEAILSKAEKNAAEAFDAATAIGVMMYDIPNCPRKHYERETSAVNGGDSTTHTVTTSFETAFEVDKQVAAAVKAALIRLANCASINKDEFKEVLRKISENPDSDQNDLSELSSECESDLEAEGHKNGETRFVEANKRNLQRKPAVEKFNRTKLVDMMLQRLQRLQEDELASLATTVATCGLNAALDEAEICSSVSYLNNVPKSISSLGERNTKKQEEPEIPSLDKFLVKHLTRLEREVLAAKNANRQNNDPGEERGDEKLDNTDDVNACTSKTKVQSEAEGLANILVKHSSKFEKEIEDAKKKSGEMFETEEKKKTKAISSFETVPDLGSMLTKRTSKLEKEIEEVKRTCGKMYEPKANKLGRASNLAVTKMKQENIQVPSLDKFLVKHVSRLEKEVLEAKMKRNTNLVESGSEELDLIQKSVTSLTTESSDKNPVSSNFLGKENVDINKKDEGKEMCPTTEATSVIEENKDTRLPEDGGLDKILVKKVHWLEKEKMKSLSSGSEFKILQRKDRYGGDNAMTTSEGLDKVLIKHVSRLEKEKMAIGMDEEKVMKVKRSDRNLELDQSEGRSDQIVDKHISSLESEKVSAAEQLDNNPTKHPLIAQKEARERELQESWGGMSFGYVMRPHVSRLERDKAAWLKAEKDGRR